MKELANMNLFSDTSNSIIPVLGLLESACDVEVLDNNSVLLTCDKGRVQFQFNERETISDLAGKSEEMNDYIFELERLGMIKLYVMVKNNCNDYMQRFAKSVKNKLLADYVRGIESVDLSIEGNKVFVTVTLERLKLIYTASIDNLVHYVQDEGFSTGCNASLSIFDSAVKNSLFTI